MSPGLAGFGPAESLSESTNAGSLRRLFAGTIRDTEPYLSKGSNRTETRPSLPVDRAGRAKQDRPPFEIADEDPFRPPRQQWPG